MDLDWQNFEELEILSKSPSSTVLLIRNKVSGKKHVLKAIVRLILSVELKKESYKRLAHDILYEVNHPFIIKQYCTYTTLRHVCHLLEYIDGVTLSKALKDQGKFSLKLTQFYAAQIVLALEYLHLKNICYRNLKPENILVDKVGYITMYDFKFAKRKERTFSVCGNPEYLAPEIILGQGHGLAVDWWAMGIIVYEMLTGFPPFVGAHSFEIFSKICEANFTFPTHIDDISKDLICSLLRPAPHLRLGNRPLNPLNFSGGISDVKSHKFFEGTDWKSLEKKECTLPTWE